LPQILQMIADQEQRPFTAKVREGTQSGSGSSDRG